MTTPSLSDKIEHAKRELERMIDLHPQGMLLVDRGGIVRRANRAMLNLLGREKFHLILDRPMDELLPGGGISADISKCFCDPRPSAALEHEMFTDEGVRRILHLTVVCSGPDTEMAVVLATDVTDEKARSVSLEKLHKKEAVTVLMGALMHHINQPLTVITLQTHLLQLNLDKPDADHGAIRQGLREIGDLAQQIAGLLGKLKTPVDVATETYIGDAQILDIERATGHVVEMACARLMAALELHAPGATGHGHRTADLAARIASAMGIDAITQSTIWRGANLHDIGALGVPEDVLRKSALPGADESDGMRQHAVIGYEILRGFQGLEQEAEIAYMHHERHDGTGYPRRLTEKDISLPAAIVAVAEGYDLLRHQHPAKSHAEVHRCIVAGSGTQYRPDVVTAFRTLPVM